MTTKNTTLKIVSAWEMPAVRGNVAKIIGTDPLSPTQESITFFGALNLNGNKHKNTLTGRAITIRINQKSQRNKHDNLADPRKTVMKFHNRLLIRELCLSQHQTCDVYRKDPV